MPVSALDQHLQGNCRQSATPVTVLPDRSPGRSAPTRPSTGPPGDRRDGGDAVTTFGYAERPVGLTGQPARSHVNERPAARAPSDEQHGGGVRGDGASQRIRSRPHHNEPPPRPAVPGGNAKPAGGRVAVPSRPAMPVQGRRVADTPAVTTDPAAR